MAKTKPFDEHTHQYEDWFKINEFAYLSELQAVKEKIPQSNNGIEIGVGSGLFSQPLGIKFGVEPSEKMREIAKQRGIEVVDGLAENLPIEDSKFDFALLVTTICFVDDLEKTFNEAYRIIKKGGSIIVGFIDSDSPIGKMYQLYKDESVFYKDATFYSTNEVVSVMKGVGFKNFSFSQTIFNMLNEIKGIEPVKEGFGEGSFVVINAFK
ncbi:MAG: class I SAM-dependent methyltransferase [Ignavibacteriales bacterium]|nr:class I SAM-dependent methyltransferase [Ignavibacteriales bacterium]